jgi:hypothetical protein
MCETSEHCIWWTDHGSQGKVTYLKYLLESCVNTDFIIIICILLLLWRFVFKFHWLYKPRNCFVLWNTVLRISALKNHDFLKNKLHCATDCIVAKMSFNDFFHDIRGMNWEFGNFALNLLPHCSSEYVCMYAYIKQDLHYFNGLPV